MQPKTNLGGNSNQKTTSLRFCQICDCREFALALNKNTSLKRLWLNDNLISDCTPFVEVLDRSNKTLRLLEIRNNPLKKGSLGQLAELIEKKIVVVC